MILTSVAEIISSREKKDGILLLKFFFTLRLFSSCIFNGASNECTQVHLKGISSSIPFSNQPSKTYWILLVNMQKDEAGRFVSMKQMDRLLLALPKQWLTEKRRQEMSSALRCCSSN